MDNRTIAQQLMQMAHTLEGEHANLYRIQAYRRAAETILGLDQPVEDLVTGGGPKALRRLPGIGGSLSEKIVRFLRTGEFGAKEDAAVAK